MYSVCERVRHRLWGTCNNRTIVPRKEIQWHNGTPQEKFKGLAGFGHKREDNEVPHKCHVYIVSMCVCVCVCVYIYIYILYIYISRKVFFLSM